MLLIPAIDLKQGKCVRLLQGQEEEQTVYSDNPVSQALEFQKAGALRLHLVDLDGAFRGRGENHETIRKIISALKIPVQVGGGIRSPEDVVHVIHRHQILLGGWRGVSKAAAQDVVQAFIIS